MGTEGWCQRRNNKNRGSHCEGRTRARVTRRRRSEWGSDGEAKAKRRRREGDAKAKRRRREGEAKAKRRRSRSDGEAKAKRVRSEGDAQAKTKRVPGEYSSFLFMISFIIIIMISAIILPLTMQVFGPQCNDPVTWKAKRRRWRSAGEAKAKRWQSDGEGEAQATRRRSTGESQAKTKRTPSIGIIMRIVILRIIRIITVNTTVIRQASASL